VKGTDTFKISTGRNALGNLEIESLDVFNEKIDFALEASVPDPVRFADRIRGMIDTHASLLIRHTEIETCEEILREVGEYDMLDEGGKTLDQEQEREQQQEQQREVKARRDQEIEVEKFVDQAYRRDNETQQSWHISDLAKPDSEQFYPMSKFKLQHRRALAFPDRMSLSSNFFNPTWSGLRRIKNCIMVMEWVPNTENLKTFETKRSSSLTEEQSISMKKAFSLLKFDPRDENTKGLTRHDLRFAVRAVANVDVDGKFLDDLIRMYGVKEGQRRKRRANDEESEEDQEEVMNVNGFSRMIQDRALCPVQNGRRWVAVSLAEAETLRRILHGRGNGSVVLNSPNTQVALRCVRLCVCSL